MISSIWKGETDVNTLGLEKIFNPYGTIKQVVAVMSGKGGVGKSSVTAMLAASLNRQGISVGVLDADVTGPSIPRLFGVHRKIAQDGSAMIPVETAKGIKIVSINLLLDQEDQPVVWRGPLISGVVKQFFEEVFWGDLDFLLVDLPPGTGDVPLTVMQSLPLDGLVVVTTPQELVAMIVKKAIHMAGQLNIPVLGMIENMSYLECPGCKKKIDVFGKSKIDTITKELKIPLLGRLPLIPEVAALSDEGKVELISDMLPDFFAEVTEKLQVSLSTVEKQPV